MSEWNIFRAALIRAAVLEAGSAVWLFRLNPAKQEQTDRLPRNKKAGIVLGFLALLWCVPHAEPIVFNWMLPWLYPAVILFTVLSWFFLDYLFSRAVGGLLILGTCYFVYGAFNFHTPSLAAFSILYWLAGIAGICFSGKPCWMRDLFRLCCKSSRIRWTAAGFCALLSAASILAAILTKGGQC